MVEHGITALALANDDVLHLQGLPPMHKDLFDRMLICQAIENGLAILTPDQPIRQYPVETILVTFIFLWQDQQEALSTDLSSKAVYDFRLQTIELAQLICAVWGYFQGGMHLGR